MASALLSRAGRGQGVQDARPRGAISEDAQACLIFPLHVVDLDLQAGIDEVGGKDFVALLGVEATGTIELRQAPTSDRETLRAPTFEDEVVRDALESGRDALQTEGEVEHAVTAHAVTEAGVGDGGGVVAGGREDLGKILGVEKDTSVHGGPPETRRLLTDGAIAGR
jgi:hypothetical protein